MAVPAGSTQWKNTNFVMYGLAKQPPRTDWYEYEGEWEY